MNNITIKKTDTFFIAACMSGLHSYITVGAQQTDGSNVMLLDVGKAMSYEERQNVAPVILFKMLLGILNSSIMNEQKLVNPKNTDNKYPISYIAYEINLKNYLTLLEKLNHLNPELHAYVPTNMHKKGKELKFSWKPLKKWFIKQNTDIQDTDIQDMAKHCNKLSFIQNCRVATQQLAQATLPEQTSTQQTIHWNFLTRFPCQNELVNGRFSKPLIILPPPPTTYHISKDKQQVLNKLYHRLVTVLTTYQNNPQTLKKFNCLKEIYQQSVRHKEIGLEDLLHSILEWADNHKILIDTHRGFHFFSQKTSTRNFIHEMEEENRKLEFHVSLD